LTPEQDLEVSDPIGLLVDLSFRFFFESFFFEFLSCRIISVPVCWMLFVLNVSARGPLYTL